MSNHHVNLTQQENSLVDEAAPHVLERLDEKSLKDLQSRLRTARDKNFSLLRREGAARVEAEGGRGAAQPANERRSDKVDVIDEALARVTDRLDALRDAGIPVKEPPKVTTVGDLIRQGALADHPLGDAAFDRLAGAGAELVTTEMVAFEWLRTASHPAFKAMQALVK
jgi:hypothetical protein